MLDELQNVPKEIHGIETGRTAQRMFFTASPHGVPEMFMAANCFWTAASSVALQQEVPL
jgi:hypothetical protein